MGGKSVEAGLARMFCSWFLLCVPALPAGAGYGGGFGTAGSPFLIFTAEQLNTIGSRPGDWDKHFRIMADIDLAAYGPEGFRIIGTSEDGSFTGVFDGNGKVISNFRRSADFGGYLGLFGLVEGAQARIENVTLVNPRVTSEIGRYLGALAGSLREGTIANCHIRGGAVTGLSFVGGLVGTNEAGTISHCTASATVQGTSRVGGLLGRNYYGLVERCRAAGEVLGPSSSYWIGGLIGENRDATVRECRASCTVEGDLYVGGLIGESITATVDRCCAAGMVTGGTTVGGLVGQNSGGTISDSYATAGAKGTIYVGGLAGCNGPDCHCVVRKPGIITRCYATGLVWGVDSGGLIGLNDGSQTHGSFWDIETTGRSASGGGDGKTTQQMGNRAMYLIAGWDFAGEKNNGTQDIWLLPVGESYPRLVWELVPGDLNVDGRVDFRDFSVLAAQWRRADPGVWSSGALVVQDGTVDLDDLSSLARAWLSDRR